MILRCSQATCKARVPSPAPGEADPWPLRCAECDTALYPRDELDRRPVNELLPNRGVLLCETSAGLVEANAADVLEGDGDRPSLFDALVAEAPRDETPDDSPEAEPSLLDAMLDGLDGLDDVDGLDRLDDLDDELS